MKRVSAALAVLLASAAWADGAFPDSMSLILPPDRPNELVLVTNFGLLQSEDNGATWYLVCEQAMNAPNGFLYQRGPAPPDRLYAVSLAGLSVSSDDACSWSNADGGVSNAYVQDAFPDPGDPNHVLAIANPPSPQPMALLESTNGGYTFDSAPLFATDAGTAIFSVEISRSNPSTVYLTLFESRPDAGSFIARSDDRGRTWQTFDLTSVVGPHSMRIAAVDPDDSQRLYLRVTGPPASPGDRFAIATDGGASIQVPLQLDYPMSGFLRRSDRAEIVTAFDPLSGHAEAYLSTDGQSFQPWQTQLHLRSVGERDGGLFLVGDNFQDGFAVASADLNGNNRQTLLQFNEICGPKACGAIPDTCQSIWGGPTGLAATFGIDGGCGAPPPNKGCHCEAVDLASAAPLLLLLGLLRRRYRGR